MKVRFFVITVLLPLLVYLLIGVFCMQYPLLRHPLLRYGISIVMVLCSIIGFSLYVLKRKNSRWYLFLLIAVFSLLIEIVTSPLRGYQLSFLPGGGGMKLCAVVTFILYFVFINLMLKKYTSKIKSQWILIACLLGSLILQLPIRIFSFNSSLSSFLDFMFHMFGIFMGYIFYMSSKYIKSGIIVASILSCTFLYFKGYDLWLHKLNFGTFTGDIQYKAEIPEFLFMDKDGNAITRQNFAGKYVVLDFWHTSCGVCFQKFPMFEEQYVKYSSNNNVILFAVNVKLPRDKEGISFEIFSERGYAFPTLQFGQQEEAKSIFGVSVFPTVVVLNPTGAMVFRGNSENAFKYIENELNKN